MTVLYILSGYNSFNRGGKAYCDMIRRHPPVTLLVRRAIERPEDEPGRARDLELADVVVLHGDLHNYESIYERYPALRHKYVISRCVWETDELPDAFKRSLSCVQELWTPSNYCRAVFERYHDRVFQMPHPIYRDTACSDADRAQMKARLRYDDDCVYFLMITRVNDKRKNTKGLIRAFERQRRRMPKARLVIKGAPEDAAASFADPRIIVIPEQLSPAQITALYECADVYVSPHHSEGWGWTLADALLLHKPTIATGYSGNLEFMNAGNSFLLDYREEHIHEDDVEGPFTSTMKWAYPIEADLEEKMWFLYNRDEPAVRDEVERKIVRSTDLRRFAPEVVGERVRARLDALARELACRPTNAEGARPVGAPAQ